MDPATPQQRYAVPIGEATLERLTMDHLDEMWALLDAERAHLDLWQPPAETTKEELATTIERAVRAWSTGYQYRFAVRHRGALVGQVGFVDVYVASGVGELGYWLARGSSGFGLATESVRTLTSAGFRDMGLQRVEVTTAMGNMPSRRVVERLGFQLEGVRRSCERIASGALVDHALYGVLVDDWRG